MSNREAVSCTVSVNVCFSLSVCLSICISVQLFTSHISIISCTVFVRSKKIGPQVGITFVELKNIFVWLNFIMSL